MICISQSLQNSNVGVLVFFTGLLWLVNSHCRHRQDKTLLSCLVLSCRCSQCELNCRQVKTDCDWKFRNSFEMRCELSLVLFPICNVVTYCDVIFGNWVKTSSQMSWHHRQDWTKLFCLQYIENCLRLSRTQFTRPTRQDSLVLNEWLQGQA